MGLEGFYNLGGLEIDNCYIHIIRFQVKTTYSKIGDSNDYAKYLIVDYDFNMFKDYATCMNDPSNPIQRFTRNRFSYQLLQGGLDDIWQIIYDDIKTKELFRDFLPEEE